MEQIKETQNIFSSNKKGYIIKTAFSLLLLFINPEQNLSSTEKVLLFPYGNENAETTSTKEIVKEAIKNTLCNLKSLNDLPKTIIYKKKSNQNMPDAIDINPKNITTPVEGITIILGKRKFFIDPLLGNIEGIHLNKESLTIETTYLNRDYSLEEKLPELCWKLWNSPKGKGEKSGFLGAKVTEL